jgi:hypothetical protein
VISSRRGTRAQGSAVSQAVGNRDTPIPVQVVFQAIAGIGLRGKASGSGGRCPGDCTPTLPVSVVTRSPTLPVSVA